MIGCQLQPQYLIQYPELKKGAQSIIPLVQQLRGLIRTAEASNDSSSPKYELEARFGVIKNSPHTSSSFASGLTVETINAFCVQLKSYPGWHDAHPWHRINDFFHCLPGEQAIRTRVVNDRSGLGISTTHIKKQRLAFQNLHYVADPGTGPDLRVALHKETPVDENIIRAICKPTHVRLHHRTSFIYQSPSSSVPSWQFDVSMVWSGTSQTDAEQKTMTELPTYEFECELLNPEIYLNEPHHDDSYVATALLLKMCDFLPKDRDWHLEPSFIRF